MRAYANLNAAYGFCSPDYIIRYFHQSLHPVKTEPNELDLECGLSNRAATLMSRMSRPSPHKDRRVIFIAVSKISKSFQILGLSRKLTIFVTK